MKTLRSILYKISQHDILTHSAALALYTAFSLAPLIILMLSILATLQLDLQIQLLANVQQLMGTEAASVLDTIIKKSEARADLSSLAGWVGVITLLFSASAIFAQLQNAMNVIFESTPDTPANIKWYHEVRHIVLKRIASFGMVLSFVFLSIVSLVISSALSFLFLNNIGRLGEIINFSLNLLVFTLLFGALFKWIPDKSIPTKSAFEGGLLTALLFVIGKGVIGLYLGQTAVGSAYGAAGSLIVLLVWVYYSSLIVFFGAEICAKRASSQKTKLNLFWLRNHVSPST
ncbi:MAG: YihY/virulence factor BrkB family protein [Bdellovibrionales bacterium]